MPSSPNPFVWCELMTTDTVSATEFYCSVIGWTARDSGLGKPYTILSAGETGVGGLMALPDRAREAGARPGWMGYIGVSDVDAFAARIREARGRVHHDAEDIPEVGRFAVVADPQGAPFVLFQPSRAEPPPRAPAGTPGHVGWHELQANNAEEAFAFYASLFGWTKAQAIDMGAMGVYQLFATGGEPVGGMMTRCEAMPGPFWLYYFNVDGIDAAASRVKDRGGRITNGPLQVPGGSWIIQCLDPQGAMFAMVSATR